MSPNFVYYIIFDNAVQWFSYTVKVDLNDQKSRLKPYYITECKNLTSNDPKVTEIMSREQHFDNQFFQGGGICAGTFYGWTISEKEYDSFIDPLVPQKAEDIRAAFSASRQRQLASQGPITLEMVREQQKTMKDI